MNESLEQDLPSLSRVIIGCGGNIWAYPHLSDPDLLHRIGLRDAIRVTAATLPAGGIIADLGCGWMPYKEWFARPGRTYIPLDVTGYPDKRFRLIGADGLPLDPASVDVVVCWQVLEHVSDMEAFFRGIKRIMKPGGRGFFTTHGLFRIHDREDFWRWTPEGLRQLFAGRGFTGFRIRPCDSIYAIIASLLNRACRPCGRGILRRALYRGLCSMVNLASLTADRVSDVLGLTGHRAEATTYLIEVVLADTAAPEPEPRQEKPEVTSPLVSVRVAVCTRNRAADLERLLPDLEALDYPRRLVEFALVDNGSTDATAQIAGAWCARQPNAQYLREDRAGLPFARNLAWRTTDAELVVYLDDDATPERDWLRQLVAAYHRGQLTEASPHLAIGGRVKLRLPEGSEDTSGWLGEDMLGWLSELDYGPDTFLVDKPRMNLMGANFAVPRHTLERIGGFAEELPGYGGDERWVENRIRAAGGRLIYAGGAIVHHRIGCEKLTPAWFRHRLLVEGKAVAHLRMNLAARTLAAALRSLLSAIPAMTHGAVGAVRHKLDPTPERFSQSCRLWFAGGLVGETAKLLVRGRPGTPSHTKPRRGQAV